MTDKQKTKQLEVRLAFATQENVLHEQLAALTSELAEARQRNPSEEQWEAVLPHFLDLCEAVALFRARWREIMRPDR